MTLTDDQVRELIEATSGWSAIQRPWAYETRTALTELLELRTLVSDVRRSREEWRDKYYEALRAAK